MKKIIAFFCFFSGAALSVSAQKKLYLSQDPAIVEWVDSPRIHPVPPEYANEPAFYLLYDKNVDYRYEGKGVNTHFTTHGIVKVLDEQGIERFNKIRVPVEYGMRVPLIRARSISPSGKVHDIAKEMIKVTKDERGHYMISIALEGIERNSEVEYLVKEIHAMPGFGRHYFQFGIPIAKARFRLCYPKEYVFEMRSYNGFPEIKDSLIKNRKYIKVDLSDIPALANEPYSFSDLHRMGIEYRASYWTNGNNEKVKFHTWNKLSREELFDKNYKLSEKERKAVNRFLSELGVLANGDEVENIKKIEHGIKTRITLYPFVDYDLEREELAFREIKPVTLHDVGYDDKKDVLDTIIAKKATNYPGYIKLFAACLAQAGVKHELGKASDRSENKFEAAFESWMGLNDYLFYFPNQKKFLDPSNEHLRYPVVPDELVGGKGVFCTIPLRGEITGPLYKIRTITPLSAKETREDINASVTFTKDMDADVDMAYSWYGYMSTDTRTILPFIHNNKDLLSKFVKTLIPMADNPEDIVKYSFSNEAYLNYYDNKPLQLYASVHSSKLVTKAADKYLLNIGKIAGEQAELYSRDKRTTPVDLEYPYSQNRTITVNIPKGYKILNPEVLQMTSDYLIDEQEPVISFKSGYRIVKDKKNGDKLVVTINEYCKQTHFALTEYDRYRKVINTAADFDNVTLLMGKK